MKTRDATQDESGLSGMLLIAMPGMPDQRFTRSVIYLCSYSSEGAMGLILNQRAEDITFDTVIEQMGLETDERMRHVPVHVGGPVETERGFVLHTSDYQHDSTMLIDKQYALTATVEIMQEMSTGGGPERALFALGYAGWGAGQLDQEIQRAGWLLAPADPDVIFDQDVDTKWQRALARLGVDPALLAGTAGHA